MKPKVRLNSEQLRLVDSRRTSGWSWSAIGRELGVNRQIIKREYMAWSDRQLPDELQAVRQEAAADAFEQHLNLLLAMGRELSDRLEAMSDSYPLDVSGEDVFNPVIDSDKPLQHAGQVATSEPRKDLRRRRRRWVHEALMTHLGGSGWDEAFEAWVAQYRSCSELLLRLKHQALIHLSSYLKDLTQRREWDSPSGHLLAEEVATAAWTAVRRARDIEGEVADDAPGELALESSPSMDLSRRGSRWAVQTATKEVLLPTSRKDEADRMRAAFERGVADLLADERTAAAVDGLQKLNERLEGLLKLLDPLSLHPVLLRTRCDQCPA